MIHSWLHSFRRRLANNDSLIHFSVLGVLAGLGTGLVCIAFRFLIEWPAGQWLPNGDPEGFESLPRWMYFALPFTGALVLGLIFRTLHQDTLRTGVTHVITHLHADDGHLPAKNAVVQFFAGAFALGTGQSGGREGPAVHLGAAGSSVVGQALKLPNNSIRVLVGCGTAAAIAASFNTPIAGVIFAMEVVMMEYSIAGFTPVILATITATAVTRAVYGAGAIFVIPSVQMSSLWELPYIALLGLLIGACAALFIVIIKLAMRLSARPVLQRMALAGFVTGCCALLVPQILGTGYDTLNALLSGNIALPILLALIATKLLASALSSGLGMPIGLIGPCLLIGACIGAVMATLGASMFPELASGGSFYVMLGMGAMMGAVLNAPLAALMTLLELTHNPAIIFPGMLAITIASITNSEIFKQRSAHQTVINYLQLALPTDPNSLALQRTGVATLMQRNICITESLASPQQCQLLLTEPYQAYVVSEPESAALRLIYRADLAPYLEQALNSDNTKPLALLELCSASQPITTLHIQATLREALATMTKQQTTAVYIAGYVSGRYPDRGIVTREDIERHHSTPQK